MGFLDDVQASINRGTAAAGRTTKITQLKSQANGLLKDRQRLAGQLGAALYEKFKDDPTARIGAEALFDGIAAIDAQRTEIQNTIDALQAEAEASQAAAIVYTCPGCGSRVPATDMFCSGCGKPIDEIKAAAPSPSAPVPPVAASGKTCSSCGAPMGEEDLFCMSCGAKAGAPAPAAPVAPAPVDAAPVAPEAVAAAPVAPVAPAAAAVASVAAPEETAGFEADVESDVELSQEPAEEVVAEAEVVAESDPEPVVEDATPQVPACPGCGAEIAEDDLFCGSCGYKLK